VFWFQDGTVIFQVEDCLFKVHRYFFERHSPHFRTLLGTTPVLMGPAPVYSLSETTKAEFEKLLYIFYPSSLSNDDLTTVDDWSTILALANRYKMFELYTLAIQKLAPIASSVEKLAIVKKYNMVGHEWLLPAYTDLCSRNGPLSLDEAEKLDMQTVLKIWEVQHEIASWPGMYFRPGVEQLVKGRFGLV